MLFRSLLKAGQVGTFLKMRSTIGISSDSKTSTKKSSKRKREDFGLSNSKIDKDTIETISEDYKKAIKRLSKILQLETKGDFKAGDEIFNDE